MCYLPLLTQNTIETTFFNNNIKCPCNTPICIINNLFTTFCITNCEKRQKGSSSLFDGITPIVLACSHLVLPRITCIWHVIHLYQLMIWYYEGCVLQATASGALGVCFLGWFCELCCPSRKSPQKKRGGDIATAWKTDLHSLNKKWSPLKLCLPTSRCYP